MTRVPVTPVARQVFLDLLAQQEAKGIATYGESLTTDNGRDPIQDALEELVDLFQYLVQARLERAEIERLMERNRELAQMVEQFERDDAANYPRRRRAVGWAWRWRREARREAGYVDGAKVEIRALIRKLTEAERGRDDAWKHHDEYVRTAALAQHAERLEADAACQQWAEEVDRLKAALEWIATADTSNAADDPWRVVHALQETALAALGGSGDAPEASVTSVEATTADFVGETDV